MKLPTSDGDFYKSELAETFKLLLNLLKLQLGYFVWFAQHIHSQFESLQFIYNIVVIIMIQYLVAQNFSAGTETNEI